MKKIISSFLIGILLFMTAINVYSEELASLQVNAEGLGQIIVVPEGEAIEFRDDYPIQSVTEEAGIGSKYTIAAKASDGWKFVKWTLYGEDFSIEETLTIEIERDMELLAIFESENNLLDKNITKKNNIILYMIIGVGATLILILGIALFTKKRKHKKRVSK